MSQHMVPEPERKQGWLKQKTGRGLGHMARRCW